MKRILSLSLIASATLLAGGYKVPEQSLNAMALGAAYVAHTTDADTAYYNPANMSFLNAHTHYLEEGVTIAHLPSQNFEGSQYFPGMGAVVANGESEPEYLPIPYVHYVAPAMGAWRYGVSLTSPAGLTKRWNSPVQKLFSEEFSLINIELNPVLSYKFSDALSIAGGVRVIYTQGKVYGDGNTIGVPYKREMKGNTTSFGYNAALSWRPAPNTTVAATYRSNVDLNVDGQANLYFGNVGQQYDASVSVPIPAALNVAVSHTWAGRLTTEFVYERTFWSSYESLDFEYNSPIQPGLVAAFDDPKAKNWKDTNTYRFGISYDLDEKWTLMGGYSYDQTPVPSDTLNYELADSDAHIFSAGFRYHQTERLSWGAAILYDSKNSRTVRLGENSNGIDGKFSEGGAVLITIGASYTF